jgi:protein-S-isoprenylcysteine O-methyltransferase Ste14
LYSGFLGWRGLWLGWALWWNQWGSLFSAIGAIALLCLEIKFIEEPELTKRFGGAYKEYKKETPFVVPRIRF